MSFAFLALYTGDYVKKTRHLTPEEHGIYLLLLIHSWDTKGPAPLDERKLCAIVNARSGGEIESLRRVLAEYFVRAEDGWYNERMQSEIADAEFMSKRRSEAGKLGAQARVKHREIKKLKQVLSNCQASAKHEPVTPTLTLTPTLKKSKPSVRISPWESPPDGVSRETWDAYLEVRKRKRAPMTERALAIAIRSLQAIAAAGHSVDAAVAQSAQANWVGLFLPRGAAPTKGQKSFSAIESWLTKEAAK